MENVFVRNNGAAILASIVATGLSYGVGLHFEWIKDVSILEAFAVFTSYWCTYLCVVQTRFNYIIGVVSVISLAFTFYQHNLLGSMALQIYLIPTLAFGYWRWRADTDPRPVTRIGVDKWLAMYLSIAVLTYAFAVYINSIFGGTSAFIDTAIFVASVVAQFLLDNKKVENWLVWLMIDIVSVFLYWQQDLKIVAIQMGVFGLNAIWGYYEWHRSMVAAERVVLKEKYYGPIS